jgi:CRP/FNR family transcriptional activator FtrB
MKPGIEALRGIPLFAACTDEVLARLNDSADLARLGPDDLLFREGDHLEELNVLISGYVVITTGLQANGDDTPADLIEPIRPIALTVAFRGGPVPFGARAATASRVIMIAVPALRTTIQRVPALRSAFFDRACDDLETLTLENHRLKLRTSAQRLAGYLLSLIKEPDVNPARFVLPYEKRLLAAKLGCSKENLSRIFDTLRSVGVTTRDKAVVVGSVSALREYAEAAGRRPDTARRWAEARARPRQSAILHGGDPPKRSRAFAS